MLRRPLSGDALVSNSARVAAWTAVSRVTGFVRAVAVAAVLGPTFLGSLFQATYVLPALFYQMLVGSLFVALLVPALVSAVDARDAREAARIAGGFMTVACLVFAVVAVIGVALGPLLLRIFTAGVADPAAAADQRRAGWIFLALMMPQVVLFGVAGTGAAVMNAHGRFALAAAAPALENLGVTAVMAATAILFGIGHDVGSVGAPELAVLGIGATGAVALHAGAQWWGARRLGVRLLPRAGWRHPVVRTVLRRAVPSLGVAGFDGLRQLAVLPVANAVPGGVVAFQLASNFAQLPVALAGKPVGTALLPRLARLFEQGAYRLARDEFVRGLTLAGFVTIPVVVAYAALADPLSRAISYGEMATPAGIAAVAASTAALAPGILGESAFQVTMNACYATRDARSVLASMVLRTGVTVTGIAVASTMPVGTAVLVGLGLAVAVGNLVGAWHLARRFLSRLPAGDERLAAPLRRTLAASLLAVAPAYVVAARLPGELGGRLGDVAGLAAAGGVGAVMFLGVHVVRRWSGWHASR